MKSFRDVFESDDGPTFADGGGNRLRCMRRGRKYLEAADVPKRQDIHKLSAKEIGEWRIGLQSIERHPDGSIPTARLRHRKSDPEREKSAVNDYRQRARVEISVVEDRIGSDEKLGFNGEIAHGCGQGLLGRTAVPDS